MLKLLNFNKLLKATKLSHFLSKNSNSFYKLHQAFVHTIENSQNTSQVFFEPVTINNIRDNEGSRKERIRWGRGPGSGKGKTSGKGHKGYKAHVGNIPRHYEGGQTPMTRRLPKHGFRRPIQIQENYTYLNLSHIIYLVLKGRLDPSKTITIRDLFWCGGVTRVRNGIKLLARGFEGLKDVPPINIEVSSASQKAIDEIKKFGGSVSSVYRSPLTLKYHIKPWKFIRKPLDPLPPFKKVTKLMNLEEKGIKY